MTTEERLKEIEANLERYKDGNSYTAIEAQGHAYLDLSSVGDHMQKSDVAFLLDLVRKQQRAIEEIAEALELLVRSGFRDDQRSEISLALKVLKKLERVEMKYERI